MPKLKDIYRKVRRTTVIEYKTSLICIASLVKKETGMFFSFTGPVFQILRTLHKYNMYLGWSKLSKLPLKESVENSWQLENHNSWKSIRHPGVISKKRKQHTTDDSTKVDLRYFIKIIFCYKSFSVIRKDDYAQSEGLSITIFNI